jgi:hypothetical protein
MSVSVTYEDNVCLPAFVYLGSKGSLWPHYTPSAYNLLYWMIVSYSMQYWGMGRLFGAGSLNKVFSVTIFMF